MSITDEDLQFMADAMWQDALLPDLSAEGAVIADLSVAGPAARPEEAGTDSDASGLLLKPKKMEWQRPAMPQAKAGNGDNSGSGSDALKKTATPAVQAKPSGNFANAANSAKRTKDKKKTPAVKTTPPLTDLYLSSPAASLVAPKRARKLSESMKGASQNQSQRARPKKNETDKKPKNPEAVAEVAAMTADPYGLPISPTSSRRPQNAASSEKAKTVSLASSVSPVASAAKRSSPLRLMPPSETKRPKSQKRVAKRSFLDPPETPETKAEAGPVLSNPVVKAPPPPAAKQKPTKAPKKKGKEPKPAAATETATRLSVTKKVIEKAGTSIAGTAKRLRPRGERAPIIISSDSDTSYLDDEDDYDSGFVPGTGDTSFGGIDQQTAAPESQLKPAMQQQPQKETENTTNESSSQDRKQKKTPAATHPKVQSAAPKGAKVKKEPTETVENRGRAPSSVNKNDTRGKHTTHRKRKASSESAKDPGDQQEKKQRHSSERDRAVAPDCGPSAAHPPSHDDQKAHANVLRPARASDPFVESQGDERLHRTQFTAKLLQSAVQTAASVPQQESPECQGPQDQTRMSFAPQHRAMQGQVQSTESDGVAREVMQLLTSSASGKAGQGQDGGQASAKDIWLNETDPYKDTSQIMSYVCKSVLRFLKSKESAIKDVADEYQQRGSAVLSRLGELHHKERRRLVQGFEVSRLRSLEVFEAAYRDVHLLAARLEGVSLVPVINEVLASNTGARLRTLQAEMA